MLPGNGVEAVELEDGRRASNPSSIQLQYSLVLDNGTQRVLPGATGQGEWVGQGKGGGGGQTHCPSPTHSAAAVCDQEC